MIRLERSVEPATLYTPLSIPSENSQPRLDRIGPYRILETLGSGGMGTVYLAEQHSPIHRRVALKLSKLGMDSKALVARSEQERQALALMQHDGIARVYDCSQATTTLTITVAAARSV